MAKKKKITEAVVDVTEKDAPLTEEQEAPADKIKCVVVLIKPNHVVVKLPDGTNTRVRAIDAPNASVGDVIEI